MSTTDTQRLADLTHKMEAETATRAEELEYWTLECARLKDIGHTMPSVRVVETVQFVSLDVPSAPAWKIEVLAEESETWHDIGHFYDSRSEAEAEVPMISAVTYYNRQPMYECW